jgi:hypothetical protein
VDDIRVPHDEVGSIVSHLSAREPAHGAPNELVKWTARRQAPPAIV